MRAYVRVRPLTDEEYQQLKRMAASRKLAAGRVKRAQVILLSNQGYRAQEIAERLALHERTARTWITCFTRLGLPGLEEGPRTGRPPVYAPMDVGMVIQISLTPPDELNLPFGSWTLDRLVAYLGDVKGIAIRRSRISEVLGKRDCAGAIRKAGSVSGSIPTSRQKGGDRGPLHRRSRRQCCSLPR